MSPDLPEWTKVGLDAAAIVGGLLGAVGGIAAWLTRNALVTKTDLNQRFAEHDATHGALDKRLGEGDRRFAVIETELKHLPKADDIHKLTDRVGAVEQTMSGFGAQLDGLREVLERVERPLNVLIDHQLKRDDR